MTNIVNLMIGWDIGIIIGVVLMVIITFILYQWE